MKSHVYSNKHASLIKVMLALVLLSFSLGSCRGTPSPSPTGVPSSATPAASDTPAARTPETLIDGEEPTATGDESTPLPPGDEELPSDFLTEVPPDLQTEMAAQSEIDGDPFTTPGGDEEFFLEEGSEEEFFTDESGEFDGPTPPANLLPEPQVTPTPRRWPTPSSLPLGDPDNPIKIGVVVSSEADLPKIDAVQELALQIGDLTGYTLEPVVARSYSELLNGLRARGIHIAFLQPFTYIYAKEKGYAEAGLMTNHFGVFAYGTQFLANNFNEELTFFFDEAANQSFGSAEEALPQLAGKRGCYVDPLSASGYVAAAGLLASYQVETLPPAFLQSHGAVVRALYVPGICDFGVTFALTGDPRTGSAILQDFPDIQEKVQVLWRSDGIIPNLNIAYQTRLPEDVRANISNAFLDLAEAEEGLTLLTNANGYEITGLEEIDDATYDPLRSLLAASRIDLLTLVGK